MTRTILVRAAITVVVIFIAGVSTGYTITRLDLFPALIAVAVSLLVIYGIGRLLDAAFERASGRDRWEVKDTRTFLQFAVLWGGFIGLIPGSFWIPDYIDMMVGGGEVDVAVAEAPAHGGRGYRHFKDAVLRADQTVVHTVEHTDDEGSTSTTHYQIAPIVPQGWRFGDPVPLWAGVVGTRLSFHDWLREGKPTQGVLMHKDGFFRRAIELANEREGLVELEGAPLLQLEEDDFEETYTRAKVYSWLTLLAACAAWLLFFAWWHPTPKDA